MPALSLNALEEWKAFSKCSDAATFLIESPMPSSNDPRAFRHEKTTDDCRVFGVGAVLGGP
jgi:hypothetical protein